jgi:hypothetical protein
VTTRFLIDNCLTTRLATVARETGYEAMHLRDLKLENRKDWDLVPIIRDGAWTLVTRNARDFRGPEHAPGTKGQYRRLPEHNGLVCLNGPPDGMDIRTQQELFRAVLAHLRNMSEDPRRDDLAAQVVEATIEDSQDLVIHFRRYDLPAGAWDAEEATFTSERNRPTP